MANFPQYQYQPQQMGYQQPMQPMYQQYQPMQQDSQLFCRPVASADEARGVPVDFSGKPMIMPHLSAGRIYVKAFDPGTGSSMLREYRLTEPEPEPPAPAAAYAPAGVVEQINKLEATVAALQDEIRTLKRRRAQYTEVNADES